MSDIDEAALRCKAERRASAKLGFYIHALVFASVSDLHERAVEAEPKRLRERGR